MCVTVVVHPETNKRKSEWRVGGKVVGVKRW